jgi:DNA-binding LytR/AlgR family response regulator
MFAAHAIAFILQNSYLFVKTAIQILFSHTEVSVIPKAERLLVHVRRDRRIVVDPDKIYFLEAAGGETHIRTRKAAPLVDIRPLGALLPFLEGRGFARVHRSYMVNLRRIQEIRTRGSGGGWEIVLKPPLKDPLPVSRTELKDLWRAFGEE